MGRLQTRAKSYLKKVTQFFEGSYCALCKCWHPKDHLLCEACLQDLPWITTSCERCAYPLTVMATSCGQCHSLLPETLKTQALWIYQKPMDDMIYQYKYAKQLAWSVFFGQWMAKKVRWTHKPDVILPVPSDPKTVKTRGFHQTHLLAKSISKMHQIPIAQEVVCLSKKRPQARLKRKARFSNHTQRYALLSPLKAKRVLIVDDVLTTGATLLALTQLLKSTGVTDIQCCVLARSVNKDFYDLSL